MKNKLFGLKSHLLLHVGIWLIVASTISSFVLISGLAKKQNYKSVVATPTPESIPSPQVIQEASGHGKVAEAIITSISSTLIPSSTQIPKSGEIFTSPVSVYTKPTSPQTYSENDVYWDYQIREAEKRAQEGKEALDAYNIYCDEIRAQRNAALAPIQQQIDQVNQQINDLENSINNRSDLTDSEKRRIIASEGGPLRLRYADLLIEHGRIYSQFESC